MRRTSQSMYQSNLKAPVTASKVFNGSNLYKSSNTIAGPVKKVEGQDLNSTAQRKTFEQRVTNLKNKPTEKVLEEEYISGLQEEIKYLEYELKLLKDKEILEREGVNELDNFLKDEIPINENILAIKNKYNATKSQLENKHLQFKRKIAEAEEVLRVQKEEIDQFHKCVDAHRKQVNDRKNEFREKLSELVKETSLTRDQYESLSQENKRKQEEIKKFNQEISAFQRRIEKERIQEVREIEGKEKAKQKFQEKFKIIKDELVESQQKMDELEAHGENNPLVDPLEKENSSLRKKIMLNEKQKSTAQNIIAQIQLFLKDEQREREIQRQQKAKLTDQSDIYRTEIQHLERYVDTLIKQQTTRHKCKILKQMSLTLHEKEENYELLTDRLRNLEQECSNLIQQKKELNDALENEKVISKEFDEKIQDQQNDIFTSKSNSDALVRLTIEINNEIPKTKGEVEKYKGRVPLVERDIEKKKITLVHLNKQVDLLKELKTLDLEQLQMISQGGSNMQHTLHSFIKNWEKIKST